MKTEKVIYKGKEYIVYNPGEIIYSTKNYLRYCQTDKRFEIVDQLDECKELDLLPGETHVKYLQRIYGLTELEYYIIVVCLGKEENLPKCTYINPYTKEKCNNPRKFRSLTPKKFQRTGARAGIFYDGCTEHTNKAAVQNAQKENYKKGVTGLQKADRKSKVWRDKLSVHAKKQMAEGNSIFSPDNVRRSDIESWKSFQNFPSIDQFKEIVDELGLDEYNLNIENCILIDKLNYMRKGNPDDICSYYITDFENNDSLFKLGVTVDIDNRVKGNYHGLYYKNPTIIITSTRKEIAELEYQVKLKFKDYITFANEAFDVKYKDEILEFINEFIASSKTIEL